MTEDVFVGSHVPTKLEVLECGPEIERLHPRIAVPPQRPGLVDGLAGPKFDVGGRVTVGSAVTDALRIVVVTQNHGIGEIDFVHFVPRKHGNSRGSHQLAYYGKFNFMERLSRHCYRTNRSSKERVLRNWVIQICVRDRGHRNAGFSQFFVDCFAPCVDVGQDLCILPFSYLELGSAARQPQKSYMV